MENKKHTLEDALQLLEQSQIPGVQTMEQNWGEFQEKLEERKTKRVKLFLVRSVAASLVLFLGITGFIVASTNTINTKRGELVEHSLPDGSTVKLNAESKLVYNSFLWNWQRSLKLTGEGFFDVQKGSTFSVKSELGTTEVLGTTFTIYAREEHYRVACFSGEVAVEAKGISVVQLQKGDQVDVVGGKANVSKVEKQNSADAWTRSEFYFDKVPLEEVLLELSRRYNYTISGKYPSNELYSGYFKQYDIKEVMKMVCLPFNLTFSVDSANRKIELANETSLQP